MSPADANPSTVSTIIRVTGSKAAPALWLGFAALCGLAGTLILYRRIGTTDIAQKAPADGLLKPT